jgi:transcriptional regulator with XRE-family HTH domain
MASFGENLRREREMRGVSLEEISSATKISVRFLHALEEEDFGKLPGGIFTRGFIRAYAKYLGLDEDRVLAEYQMVAQPRSDVDLGRLASHPVEARPEGGRAPLLATLFALILLASGYALYRYSRRSADAPPPAPEAVSAPQPTAKETPMATPSVLPEAVPAAAESAAVAGRDAAAGSVPVVAPESGAASGPEGAPLSEGGLVLQLAATERVWVAVDGDGKTLLQRVLVPNEIQTLKARERFDITTGNAHGIILTLNGETLKPLGRRGEVKSLHLTRNDVKKTLP